MRAETTATLMYDALHAIKRAVGKRDQHSIPVLSHVRIDAAQSQVTGDTLTVTATNLELALRATLPASVPIPGSVLVPFAHIHEWLGIEPNGDILTLGSDARHALSVTQARNRMTLRGIDADDFPIMPSPDNATVYGRVKASALHDAFKECEPFMAKKDDRPIFCGIGLKIEDEIVTLMASDTTSAAVTWIEIEQYAALASAVIPATAIKGILPVLKECGPDEYVTLSGSATAFYITLASADIVTRLVDAGPYPFANIYGEFHAHTHVDIAVNRAELIDTLKGMVALAPQSPGLNATAKEKRDVLVSLSTENDGLGIAIAGDDGEREKHGATVIPATYGDVRAIPYGMYRAVDLIAAARSQSGVKMIRLHVKTDAINFCTDSTGDRLVSRVYSPLESERRAARRIGATCRWSAHKDGAKTDLCYAYARRSDEDVTDEITRGIERLRAEYNRECATLDAIMADAWEGYREPAYDTIDMTRDELAVLASACAWQGISDGSVTSTVEYMPSDGDMLSVIDASGMRDVLHIIQTSAPHLSPRVTVMASDGEHRTYSEFMRWLAIQRYTLISVHALSGAQTAIVPYVAVSRRAEPVQAIGEPVQAIGEPVRMLPAFVPSSRTTARPPGMAVVPGEPECARIARWMAYCDACAVAQRVTYLPEWTVYHVTPRIEIVAFMSGEIQLRTPYAHTAHATMRDAIYHALATIPGRAPFPPSGHCGPSIEPVSMFDTASLPHMACAEPDHTIGDTLFTLDDSAAWHALSVDTDTLLTPCEPRAPIERAAHRSMWLDTADGSLELNPEWLAEYTAWQLANALSGPEWRE